MKFALFAAIIFIVSSLMAPEVVLAKDGIKAKYVRSDTTKIDFDEASIEGQMKAPSGFYLQGRKKQSLSQMVKLRSHFKRELRGSSAAVRALVK